MRISNLAIRSRLAMAFGLVVALLLVILCIAITRLNALHAAMDDVVDNRYVEIAMSNRIKGVGEAGANLVGRMLMASNPQKRQTYLDAYAKLRAVNTDNLKKFEAMLDDDEGRKIFAEQSMARQGYGLVVRKVMDLLAAGKQEEALAVYQTELAEPQARYYALIDKMVDYEARSMVQSVVHAKETSRAAAIQMIGASVLAVLLAVLTAWKITRSITRPIGRAIEMAESVAAGRLIHDIDAGGRDEVGRLITALHVMVASLHRIVSDVRTGADTISAAAHDVSQGNQDLSTRTEQQASALEETASAMGQITSAVKLGADSADKANETAARASAVASRSGEAVARIVDTMSSIANSSKRVVEIIGVIDGIAFQTNILALNAAVEAARAGENGRSFAVVASEVRNLAQRSADAAKEIKTLIAASVDQVEVGSQMVQHAGATMNEVVSSIQQVSAIVAEISASSREQSLGIDQINTAILRMDDSTRKNAAVAEQGTAASGALQNQARQLTDVVRAFAL